MKAFQSVILVTATPWMLAFLQTSFMVHCGTVLAQSDQYWKRFIKVNTFNTLGDLQTIQSDPNKTLLQKSIEMKKILSNSMGKVDPASMQVYWKLAEQFGKGFANVDNGPVTTTFMTDLALGKMPPEAIVKRTEDLKAQGKLTEESFNYFLRQAYNVKQWQVAMSDWQQEEENPAYPPRIDLHVENTELHCDENPFSGLQDCKVSFLITGRSDSPRTSRNFTLATPHLSATKLIPCSNLMLVV